MVQPQPIAVRDGMPASGSVAEVRAENFDLLLLARPAPEHAIRVQERHHDEMQLVVTGESQNRGVLSSYPGFLRYFYPCADQLELQLRNGAGEAVLLARFQALVAQGADVVL